MTDLIGYVAVGTIIAAPVTLIVLALIIVWRAKQGRSSIDGRKW